MKKTLCFYLTALVLLFSCSKDKGETAGLIVAPSVEWEASWIGINSPEDVRTGEVSMPARYLRTTFKASKRIREAKLYICGLGLYEAYLNGSKIGGPQVLSRQCQTMTRRSITIVSMLQSSYIKG